MWPCNVWHLCLAQGVARSFVDDVLSESVDSMLQLSVTTRSAQDSAIAAVVKSPPDDE